MIKHNEIRLLIVEDENFSLMYMRKVIELDFKSLSIREARNGSEAFRIIREWQPLVVLSDINMPGINGLRLLEKVNRENLKTQFVFFTGRDDIAAPIEALKLGASDYLLKPIDADELALTIQRALKRCETEELLEKNRESIEKKAADLSAVNKQLRQEINERKEIEESLRESEERFRKIIEFAPDGVFISEFIGQIDRGTIKEANMALCKMNKFSIEDMRSITFGDLYDDISSSEIQKQKEHILKGKTLFFEASLKHKLGRYVPVEVTVNSISLNGKQYVLSFVRDITERKLCEEELRKARQETVFAKYSITPQEKHIIEHIIEGKSDKELSEVLFISIHTVRQHCKNIFRKLKIHSRIQLISFFQESTLEK